MISIRTIESLDELIKIQPIWNALVENAINPTVFDSWHWQYSCAKYLQHDSDLFILCAYDDNHLIGVLPLTTRIVYIENIIPVRMLCCLGGEITDYNSFVVLNNYRDIAVSTVADYLVSTARYPLNVNNVHPVSMLYLLRKLLVEYGYRPIPYNTTKAYSVQTNDDLVGYMAQLTPKFRRNLRQNQNYMDRKGGYSYQSSEGTISLFDSLIELHSARWRSKNGPGALADDTVRKFHSALHDMPGKPFDIIYYFLTHNESIIGVLYGFRFCHTYYAYLSGFDSSHYRISPGNMIYNYLLSTASNYAISELDLLRGDLDYKRQWATREYIMEDTYLLPLSFKYDSVFALHRLIAFVKRLVPKGLKYRLHSLLGR